MKNAQKQLNRPPLEKRNSHYQTVLLNLFLNDEQMVASSHEMAMPTVTPVVKPHSEYYAIETKTSLTPKKPSAGLLREFIAESRVLIDNTQEIITSLKQKPDDLHSVITVWRTFQIIGDTSGMFGFRQLAELCRHTVLLLNRVLNRNIRYSQKCALIITHAYEILKKDHFHHIQDALGGQPFSGSPLCEKLILILKRTINNNQQHLEPLAHENGDFEYNEESDQPSRYSFKMFIQDNRLLTAQTEVALLFLKHNPGNTAAINTVFRYFHLIGTKAALFKFDYASELCRHTAVLLGYIRDRKNDYAGRNADLIVRAFTVLKKEIFLYSQAMLGGEPFAGSPNCLNMTHILKTLGF